ncbi:hypothetical protein [Flagellimonas nanhaiensis]|uniref:Uncharacterized protein n=1 Tax=Flagellimonas nanhaiensis TaxID=2292706 RepID=A0A371JUM9_9FLAO|nr:hypothetical protein [Allomuricauda nanhaiensis]RDY61523.1 hypothetical protein DX873_05025 [Allomuricauda nanhaiensis]
MSKNVGENINQRVKTFLLHDNLKRVQRIVIIIFVLVIALDVLFVINEEDEFPTFSLIVHEAAAHQYFVVTWLWGLATAQIFFPRVQKMNTISSLNKVIAVLLITSFLVIFGSIYKDVFEAILWQVLLFISGAIFGYYLLPNDFVE